MTDTYVQRARRHASAWKQSTPILPDDARSPAPYLRDGEPQGSYPFCLPRAFAAHNLLPDVRADSLAYFAAERIAWHQSIDGGPTNHLLSSQLQCVNALGPLVRDPERLRRAFADVLDIAEPLEIEPGRLVAFEYIGEVDHLGETTSGARTRGSMTTSFDAALRYRNGDGDVELAAIEWKYVEDYRGKELSPSSHDRRARYRDRWLADDGPLRRDVIPYDDLFVEPFYQLMRQQLLADAMERTSEGGASVVRVVHVSPPGNEALRSSLNRASHRAVADDVFDVWRAVVRRPDRFVCVDSGLFCDVSGPDYVERYAGR
jgi:hypothetical protein